MGIGRRKFLKLFGASLAVLATQPSQAVAVQDDLYINRKLGMAFRKPYGWHFADVKEMGEIARGQRLDIDGLDMDELFGDEDDLPLVTVIQKAPSATTAEFTPGINFYLQKREGLAFLVEAMQHLGATVPPVDNAAEEVRCLSRTLPEFQVLSEPTEVHISDCPAAHYSIAFEFRHQNLEKPVRVRQRTVSIIQLPAWHRVYMYDSPYTGDDRTLDFDAFIESIRLV